MARSVITDEYQNFRFHVAAVDGDVLPQARQAGFNSVTIPELTIACVLCAGLGPTRLEDDEEIRGVAVCPRCAETVNARVRRAEALRWARSPCDGAGLVIEAPGAP